MILIDGPGLPLAPPHPPFEADPAPAPPEAPGGAGAFATLLEQVATDANAQLQAAQAQAEAFAAGRNDDIHGTMLALSKADIELRLVGNIRNKIVDAFYELWRMQV